MIVIIWIFLVWFSVLCGVISFCC